MRKKKLWGALLGVFAAVALICGVVTACANDPDGSDKDHMYVITVKSLGGMSLSDVTVTATDGGEQIASVTTDEHGEASFEADPGEYTLTVSNLPAGYFLPEGASYKTNTEYSPVIIYLESGIIKDQKAPANYQYKLGDVMYDFTLTDPDGETEYTLSELLEGKKMVLLNFWDTGCNPCVTEMPSMQRAWEATDGEGIPYSESVSILAVDVRLMNRDTDADIIRHRSKTFEDEDGRETTLTYPMALDSANLTYMFNITAIPVSVVVDRYGVIAYMDVGSMRQSEFERLFEKYISDDYVQQDPNNGSEDPALEWARPDPSLRMPASSVIAEAINEKGGYEFAYYSEPNPDDAEFAWPWLLGEGDDGAYIYPSNSGIDYSFAAIYTELRLTQEHIDAGKNVLAFDYQLSSEANYDIFAIIVNGRSIYELSGTRYANQWATSFAVVADREGTYTLTLVYVKDEQSSGGSQDFVHVRNMRLTTEAEINASAESLDMPSDAVWNYNAKSKQFDGKINVEKDADGFYRKDNENGYFIFANLMEATNFNVSLENDWSVSQYAINDDFNYNPAGKKDPEAEGYDSKLDFTDRIGNYARAANNSTLYGLVAVNDELRDMLNKFVWSKKPYMNGDTDAWLEFCIFFRHFGTNLSDTGYNTPESNPSLGLMFEMAIKTKTVLEYDETPTDKHFNLVEYDRYIVPRGLYYAFTPEESGVYRIETQSKEGVDTMAWIFRNDGSVNGELLLETEMQLEHAADNWNIVMTYYFEQDAEKSKTYYIAMALVDMGITNEFTFTIRHMGDTYFSWQHAQREYSTYNEDSDDVEDYVMLQSVVFVSHLDSDGVTRYYNALKNPDGTFYRNAARQYVANLKDPIYVDFVNGTHFDPNTSLQSALVMGELGGIDYGDDGDPALQRESDRGILRRVQQYLDYTFHREDLRSQIDNQIHLNYAQYYTEDTTVDTAAGKATSKAERETFIRSLYVSYGFVEFDPQYEYSDERLVHLTESGSMTLGEIARYMQQNDIRAFAGYTLDDRGVPQRYDDTDKVKEYLDKALRGDDGVFPVPTYTGAMFDKYPANAGASYAGETRTKGTVHLTKELYDILFRFAEGIIGDGQEFGRLCSHYEFLGSYDDYLAWTEYNYEDGQLKPKPKS